MERHGYYSDNSSNDSVFPVMDYFVDMVLCIDATGSMDERGNRQAKLIDMVKQNALSLCADLQHKMEKRRKLLRQLRVRIIAFRDFAYDEEDAMMSTDFFCLPQQNEEFEACIRSITASGGGDIPEDSLEALACAMKSDWSEDGTRRRQVIVLWTDAPSHPLGHGRNSPFYPDNMPRDMAELTDWWDNMSFSHKRLLLLAPDERDWDYISCHWNNVIHIPSQAGCGLSDISYDRLTDGMILSITS